jgi:dihydroneopterin aldolase
MTEHLREIEIGAFQAERGVRQTVRFDVVVEVETRAEQAADDVDRILSYDTIVEAIDAALEAERVNLLETLAARIADGILAHPLAARVFVRIGKLDRGPYTLGVEIVRERPSGPAPPAPSGRPGAASGGGVPVERDRGARRSSRASRPLAGGPDAPLILCVDRPEAQVPRAGHVMPQRRIDLLAIEQGAWCLAARDPRCVVVETRTELDWAMRHGEISVWAPSKLVLDAVHGPEGHVTAPLALAHWLADAFEARAVLEIGAPRAAVDAGAPGRASSRANGSPRGAMPDGGWLERGA